jgi:hypothetical protein
MSWTDATTAYRKPPQNIQLAEITGYLDETEKISTRGRVADDSRPTIPRQE